VRASGEQCDRSIVLPAKNTSAAGDVLSARWLPRSSGRVNRIARAFGQSATTSGLLRVGRCDANPKSHQFPPDAVGTDSTRWDSFQVPRAKHPKTRRGEPLSDLHGPQFQRQIHRQLAAEFLPTPGNVWPRNELHLPKKRVVPRAPQSLIRTMLGCLSLKPMLPFAEGTVRVPWARHGKTVLRSTLTALHLAVFFGPVKLRERTRRRSSTGFCNHRRNTPLASPTHQPFRPAAL